MTMLAATRPTFVEAFDGYTAPPPGVLFSYALFGRHDMDEITAPYRDLGASVFADSGAYTAWSSGKVIDVAGYSAWLERWGHLFSVAANLDVIGDPAGSAANLAYLHAAGHRVLPVHHGGTSWASLERMARDHPYIALGGMASGRERGEIRRFAIQTFKTLAAAGGSTRVHGFGITDWPMLKGLPWHSVDSTTWVMGVRYGSLPIFARRRLFQARAPSLGRYTSDLARHGVSVAQARRAVVERDSRLAGVIGLRASALAQQFIRALPGRGGFVLYVSGI